jgi:hypothetical protein
VPATDDRWDVVVIGLRDPSQAGAMMAVAELAHYASLPPGDVERMLEEGEVPVLENLDRAEAERAAYELAELGAVVDLRLAMGDSGVFPVFKPDAERQIGVAVGGLIDDSATPPTVGGALGLPELEPDLETPRPPRPRQPSSPGLGTAPSPRAQDVRGGPPGLDEEPPPPAASRPARQTPAPRAGEHGPHRGDVGRDQAAVAGSGRPRVATPAPGRADEGGGAAPRGRAGTPAHPKGPIDVESLLGDIGPGAPASAAPKLPQRLQRASAAAQQGHVELELDFAAAGIEPPPRRGPAAAVVSVEHAPERSGSAMPRRTRAGDMGGTGASAAGQPRRDAGALDVLRNDGIAAILVGLCVGLGLSLILALQLQRSGTRDRLPPLEEELAASLADPDGVAAGQHRDPATVESEIDDALGSLQRSFLLWWLGAGSVVGLLLSRLKAAG